MEIRRSAWSGTGLPKMQNLTRAHCTKPVTCKMVSEDQVRQVASNASFLKSERDGSSTCPSPRRGHSVTISELPADMKIAAVAGEDIPPGVLSPSISAANPMDVNTVFWSDNDIDYFVEVSLDDRKMLTSLNNNWLKHVRLAKHCHMQNIQIILTNNGGLCLQTTNTIKKGEPFFAWFALETSKSFEIPFLTLNNIKGGHHYSCHNCGKVFEDPNPLKIHIALLCPVSSLKSSFNQSEELMRATSLYQHSIRTALPIGPIQTATSLESFPLVVGSHSAFRPLKKQHVGPVCQKNTNESSDFHPSNPRFTVNGAISTLPTFPLNYGINLTAFQNFRPSLVPGSCLSYFQVPPSIDHNANLSSGPDVLSYHSVPTSAFKYLHNTSVVRSPSENSGTLAFSTSCSPNSNQVHSEGQSENQANVGGIISEQFTTSDGKSKRRHKCFYCSKMYSRKYGLKIHIRTHLNYKPLSCKVCQRRFADPSNLNKHIRLHAEGVTPYRCDLCGKVLVRRRDLERHLKSRHPQMDTTSSTASKLKTENNNDDMKSK